MAVIIEGYGGTGKAVVNLLLFVRKVATALNLATPAFTTFVVDQDDGGTLDNTEVKEVAPPNANTFQDSRLQSERLADSAWFSPEELKTTVDRGFYANPKIASTFRDRLPHQQHPNDIRIVVYGASGGTGAGLAPTRIRHLVAANIPTIAIAIGSYLRGVGRADAAGKADFDDIPPGKARFLRIWFDMNRSQPRPGDIPPLSGLNDASELLLVVHEIWFRLTAQPPDPFDSAGNSQLVQEITKSHEPWLRDPVERGYFRGVDISHALPQPPPRLAENVKNFVKYLRLYARHHRLAELVLGHNAHARLVQQQAELNDITKDCWETFRAKESKDHGDDPSATWEEWFQEGFRSFPDPKAVALWFYKAVVADPNGECARRFHQLLLLHLSGAFVIQPVRTRNGPVFLLCNNPPEGISEENLLTNYVVGAFTRDLPPWTTSWFAGALRQAVLQHLGEAPWQGSATLLLKAPGEAARYIPDGFLLEVEGLHLTTKHTKNLFPTIELAQHDPNVGKARWLLQVEVNDWTAARDIWRFQHLIRHRIQFADFVDITSIFWERLSLQPDPWDGLYGGRIHAAAGPDEIVWSEHPVKHIYRLGGNQQATSNPVFKEVRADGISTERTEAIQAASVLSEQAQLIVRSSL